MADTVRIEGVGGEILFRRLQGELVARHEGQEVRSLRTQRAIAFDHFCDRRFGLELVFDPSAMASTAIVHDWPPHTAGPYLIARPKANAAMPARHPAHIR